MPDGPLVGRLAEVESLDTLIASARRSGRAALIEGEAGIGKSRLVSHAIGLAAERGFQVLAAGAEDLDAHLPFAALLTSLRSGDTRARRAVRQLEGRLAEAEGSDPAASAEIGRWVAERALDLLDELSASAPVALAIEDLHWADSATLLSLRRILRELDSMQALLVASARPVPRSEDLEHLLRDFEQREALMLQLSPLEPEEVKKLAGQLLESEPGPVLREQLAVAGGNPLFIRELIAALDASGAIERAGGAAEVRESGAPPSLPLTILHRLSFLPDHVLETLSLAAVLGVGFSVSDLSLLSGRPAAELAPAVRQAIRAMVLAEEGERLSFRHELIRETLYQDIPRSTRRALHRELAEKLRDRGAPGELVAEHMMRGARRGDCAAIEALAAAGRANVARAPDVAIELLGGATELSDSPDAKRDELLPDLARALIGAGRHEEGEAACREALASGSHLQAEGKLLLALIDSLSERGRIAEVVTEGEAALSSGRLDQRERVQVGTYVALGHVFTGQIERGLEEAQAVEVGAEELDDGLALGLALQTQGQVAYARGELGRAVEIYSRAGLEAETRGTWDANRAVPHAVLCLALARLDRIEEAKHAARRGQQLADRLGLAFSVALLHYCLGDADYLAGRWDDAIAELDAQRVLSERRHAGWWIAGFSIRALIAIHRDDLLVAEEWVAAAERELAAGGTFGAEILMLAGARMREARGDRDGALEALIFGWDALGAIGASGARSALGLDLARLAATAGEAPRVAAAAQGLEEVRAFNGGVASLEPAALCARGLADGDAGWLKSAAELYSEAGRPAELAAVCEDVAAAEAREVGAGGRGWLERARDLYTSLGAERDVARVDAALRRRGVRRGHRGPRRRAETGWEALTETERRVVRLVAERLTNPEIAERMFISRRTVQTHVSRALAKLGVSSRRELAAVAARSAGWRLRLEGVAEDAKQPQPPVEGLRDPPVDDHAA